MPVGSGFLVILTRRLRTSAAALRATYDVSAEARGFKKSTTTGVVLNVNSKLSVNMKLEVGNVTDSVTVAADAAQVETATGEVGRLVTGEQATNLQLNGRNFPQLLQLLPGVSTTFSSGFGLFGGYGVNNSAQSINGSRTDTFSWNLDGADNKDNGGGGNNFVNINPDAIAEFKVLTTNYSAEYGYSAGAVVNRFTQVEPYVQDDWKAIQPSDGQPGPALGVHAAAVQLRCRIPRPSCRSTVDPTRRRRFCDRPEPSSRTPAILITASCWAAADSRRRPRDACR